MAANLESEGAKGTENEALMTWTGSVRGDIPLQTMMGLGRVSSTPSHPAGPVRASTVNGFGAYTIGCRERLWQYFTAM